MESVNNRIKEAIKVSGLKKYFIARKLNIAPNSLRRKLNGELNWKDTEISLLLEILEEYL